jgi:hypothetical protein
MKSFGASVVCVATCAFLLGACGPALDGEPLEDVAPTAEKPKTSGSTDPGASEIAEPGMVYAQTLVGDLGTRVGSPVATYAYISTASNQWSVSCNYGSSRDIAYVWTVPETGSYSFSTSFSNFDTVLQIRHYSSTSSVMGCNDDYGSGLQSKITLSGLVKGVKLLIIIEGYAGEYNNYARLNIIKN